MTTTPIWTLVHYEPYTKPIEEKKTTKFSILQNTQQTRATAPVKLCLVCKMECMYFPQSFFLLQSDKIKNAQYDRSRDDVFQFFHHFFRFISLKHNANTHNNHDDDFCLRRGGRQRCIEYGTACSSTPNNHIYIHPKERKKAKYEENNPQNPP